MAVTLVKGTGPEMESGVGLRGDFRIHFGWGVALARRVTKLAPFRAQL